ncbi:MAG TPA: cupin domain-containing protein [Ramlibacter sp.]|uniref:cupin domain-containing protein n=1 Tax=Ramlibacter sp. TaxID=1917967 RepID=UPI002CDD64E2|nr:cupin domain-containing protein [Ramlibacter sp.]HVZ46307.1 cupin domain-containing protein [Ramlibacter sp.]
MDIDRPLALLGGLTPRQFMKRHWQKKPLLVRGAVEAFQPLMTRKELFDLAARDDVESRLVVQRRGHWRLRRGPLPRRALPALAEPAWTLLVQGADLHHRGAYELLQRFRFVPDARLDDLMISWASDAGGVGPHFDSYDVFLLQAEGRRRWRIGRQRDLTLREGLPLKILDRFEPEEEFVLAPGDMLYLPPRYAHDGIAQGACQTYSIGFRAPARGELAQELLQRIGDEALEAAGEAIYRDAGSGPSDSPGRIPEPLQRFARDAVAAAMKNPSLLERALGEYLTEPKHNVWFEARKAGFPLRAGKGLAGVCVELDPRTRMMHDARHVYVNGESWRAGGRDAKLMRKLADERKLSDKDLTQAGSGALRLLRSWCEAGWLHERGEHEGKHAAKHA